MKKRSMHGTVRIVYDGDGPHELQEFSPPNAVAQAELQILRNIETVSRVPHTVVIFISDDGEFEDLTPVYTVTLTGTPPIRKT